jgi:hypothetical protein
MHHPSVRFAVVALAGVVIVHLSGCASSESPPSESATSSSNSANSAGPQATSVPTPAADTASGCTNANFAAPATAAVEAVDNDNTYVVNGVNCDNDWAVTSGFLSGKSNPNMGTPATLVFRRLDQQWVGQDKQKVCGTNPTTSTAPADAEIPASLYELGCMVS